MHSASSTSSEGEAAGWRYDLGTANNSSHMPVHGLPSPWSALLSRLARSGTISLSPLSQAELVAAAHDSLRHKDALPLRLRTGVLEDHYLLKRELASGAHFEVTEGVQRETQRNYSVKIVSRHVTARLGPAGAGRQLDPMQAFYLICSFVDEVFAQPHSVCLCMKWGCHEVDASHQLSCLILDALDLLRELLPPEERHKCRRLRLNRADLQRVLLRSLALDTFLQSNLYLE
jgi:hypothetical protein